MIAPPRRWAPLLLALVTLAACRATSRATVAAASAGPPAELLGAFLDDYGNAFAVSRARFDQLPSARFHIVEWHPDERFFIARNDAANPSDAGAWTRIDWLPLEGMPPYTWAFCMTAFKAPSRDAARAAAPPDRSVPRTGCNGYPFSRMRPTPDG